MELKQKQIQKQRQSRLIQDLVKKYVGKNIVMELGSEDASLSSGHLQAYDGRFLDIEDFKEHKPSLDEYVESSEYSNTKIYDIMNPDSVKYTISRRLINVNLVFSIQTLEDVVNSRR